MGLHTQLVNSFTISLHTSRMAAKIARWEATWRQFDAFSYRLLKTCIIILFHHHNQIRWQEEYINSLWKQIVPSVQQPMKPHLGLRILVSYQGPRLQPPEHMYSQMSAVTFLKEERNTIIKLSLIQIKKENRGKSERINVMNAWPEFLHHWHLWQPKLPAAKEHN